MPVRDGMTNLITRVRELIGDEAESQFTTLHIQDVLDEYARREGWNLGCRAQDSIVAGGSVRYLDFYAPVGCWEETPTLQDGTYTTLSGTLAPGTADYIRGYFKFAGSATTPFGPVRPLYITGNYYDVHLASAVLLEQWAGSVKSNVNFRDPNYQFDLQQEYAHLRQLAAHYRAMAPAITIRMVRSDT